MATRGSAATYSAVGISSATNSTIKLINRLVNLKLGEEDYKIQTIDRTTECETTLEVVKYLPKLTGEITQYVG